MTKPKAIEGRGGEIVLYRAKDGRAAVDVRLEQETVWLNLNQIAALFDRDKSVISRHLRNIFATKELDRGSTVAFFATVQEEGGHAVERRIECFNLDAILSVGYRVNSRRGTEFRIWATGVLKDHVLKGYTLNEKRLQAQVARLSELQAAVDVMGRILGEKAVTGAEAEGLLRVITDYSLALRLLDQYDHQQLRLQGITEAAGFVLTCEAARAGIARMAETMGPMAAGLFGSEKDKGLESALGAVYQTFGGRDLYLSIEEKAAHLLYFVVKNHAFVDGNKRIGAFLFIWFLDANGLLYRKDGSKRLADNALVALTLLIAESKPVEKETICKVIVNLINRENL
jgi:prophage maintenance system killer protein